jgi:hypothetical protein
MRALLATRPPDRRARIDLLRGAFDAHLRGAGPRPAGGAVAALVAGAAWTVVGVASVAGPTPPDWPGYLLDTVPVAIVGVAAVLVASLGVARLAWASNGPSLELAVIATLVGHVAWAAALVVVVIGGPYGAVTAIAQSAAAVATIGLGLVLFRARAHPVAEAVVATGGVLLVPTPVAWLVVGALWTGIGLWWAVAARSDGAPRVMPR